MPQSIPNLSEEWSKIFVEYGQKVAAAQENYALTDDEEATLEDLRDYLKTAKAQLVKSLEGAGDLHIDPIDDKFSSLEIPLEVIREIL
jgi:hypothetical protein